MTTCELLTKIPPCEMSNAKANPRERKKMGRRLKRGLTRRARAFNGYKKMFPREEGYRSRRLVALQLSLLRIPYYSVQCLA